MALSRLATLLVLALVLVATREASCATPHSPFAAAAALATRRRAILSLTLRGGDKKSWTDDLPPMPSEPPPPPPGTPSEVMGGRGRTTALPGETSSPPYGLERNWSWRPGKRHETEDTEEDYGLGTKAKANLRQPTKQSSFRIGPKWSAVPEADTASSATTPPATPRQGGLSIQQKLLAGGTSRAAAQCLLYPVDALRTLAQTRDHRTLADVGASALVRGCVTTSSFALFIGSIQFGIFGATRNACGPVIASAIGAAGSCVVSVPQEVIKQRLVTGIYSGFRDACATIYRTEGVRGFYSAWLPTMARNVPFVVSTFTANDVIKQRIIRKRRARRGLNWAGDDAGGGGGANDASSSEELTIVENLVVGIGSALIGAIITHPADVVKTRMMTQAASSQVPYSSAMDCVLTMFKTEGLPAFYSGFVQRSAYMGPLWALQFAINGRVCKSLRQRNERRSR